MDNRLEAAGKRTGNNSSRIMLKHNPKLNKAFKKSQIVSKLRGEPFFSEEFKALLSKEIGYQVKENLRDDQIMWLAGKFIKSDKSGAFIWPPGNYSKTGS